MSAIPPSEAALLDEIQQLRARLASLERERQIPKEIIEKAPVMISIVRAPDFVYELVNPAFQALAPGKEFLGRRFADVWSEVSDPLVEILQSVIATGETFRLEDAAYTIQRGPGMSPEVVYVSYSWIPLFAPDGKPDRVLTLAHEVTGAVRQRQQLTDSFTELRKAEEARRESDERFRVAQELSPDGFLIFRPLRDNAGAVTDFLWIYENDAAARMNDTDPKEVCGKRVSEVLPHHHESAFGKAYKEVAETGEVRVIEEAFYDRDTFRKRRFFRVAAVPTSGGDVAVLVQNVTERRRAEEALRESEEQFRTLANAIPQLCWMANADGWIFWYNDRWYQYTGTTPKQMEGWGWQSVHDPAALPTVLERWKASIATGRPFDMVFPLRGADGVFRPFLTRVMPVKDMEGKVVQWFGTNTDITEQKRTEEALRESEERFRSLFEHAAVGIKEVGLDGRLAAANPALCRMLGYTEGELLGKHFREFTHPDDRDREQAQIDLLLRGQREFIHIELRYLDREEKAIWVMLSSSLVKDLAGNPLYRISAVQDVDASKRAEEALRQSLERLEKVLDVETVGVMFWDLNTGCMIGANDTFLKTMGYSRGDVEGRDLTWQKLTPPEYMDVSRREVEKFLATGRVGPYEKEYLRKDGTRQWLLFAGSSLGGNQCVEFCVDISDRKKAEKALAASESRLSALLESASQGVAAVDERGRMILVNAKVEEMFGYTRDELLGQTLNILLPERFRDTHAEHMRHYFANPRTRGMGLGLALYGRAKDGAEFPVEVSLSSIDQGGSRLAMALVTDITERKKAEERLWQAQKLESIGLLAGGVAHDFNNLLVGVIGNASLAREMIAPAAEALELLDGVIRTGEQLAHLTRQMLAYSGKGRFLVEALDLSDLIPEMSSLVQPSIPKKIAVHLELEPHLPLVEADRGQLQQIFMNLVINAAEAIGSNAGLITVRTAARQVDEAYLRQHAEAGDLHPGRYVTLEVRDTGCGMDETTKTRIFDPFYSTKFTGRGLGLAAVAGIVRSHKGAVNVASTPGIGSCFTVFFPAMQGRPQVPASQTRRAPLQGTGTILIVDDERTVRELARKTLERYGYKVLLAYSGMAAIDMFKRHPGDISLVILDLSMPEMGGDEALPELRKLRPEVKVLVSSGYSESETMAFFRGQLVSGYVQKPYTAALLAEKVKAMLG